MHKYLLALFAALAVGLAGCEKPQEPAETEQAMDSAQQNVEDSIQQAAEETGEAAKQAAEATGEAVEQAAEATQQAMEETESESAESPPATGG